MKFTKLAKSDKFEYMMLSRLIQDAKYFIEHPDLKHLWAKTLEEHIDKMLEQYTKLDPKPEWTSEDEIYELADKMKESYTNHWNEIYPDNKIEANNYYKVKDNFKVNDNFKVGDKVFFDTLYEFQEDDLGFNYDRGILKEIKHWPSNNREYYIVQTDDGKLLQVGNVFHTEEEKDAFTNNWMNPKFEKESAITQPNKPKPTTILPDNMEWAWDPDAADWVAVLKDNANTTPPLYDPNNQNVVNNTTTYMSNIKSASVIDGDEDEDSLWVRLNDLFLSDGSLVDSYIKNEINCDDILNALNIEIKNKREYKKVCNYIKEFVEDNYIIKSSSNKIQSALKLEDLRDINGKTPQEGMWLYYPMIIKEFRGSTPKYLFQVKIRHSRNGEETPYLDGGSITKGISYVKKGILFDTYEEADRYKREHMSKEEKEYEDMDAWAKTKWQLDRYSSCLSEFLDGPRYSKEIKIEAGLIEDGLVKYAGFDFNRGTKYAITTKGLEVLRKASEAEHNEALNEREKLAYMFGFNTDKETTLDTTGKVIKQSAKKWTICEADGTELGEVEANSELDAKVKFGIEHPEYAESLSICAKEIKAGLEYSGAFEYNNYKIDLFNDTDGGATFVIYAPEGKTVNHESMYKGTASTMDEAITKAYKIIDGSKEIDAKYEETTEQPLDYPNPSETPTTDVILENHTGWVNTASFEDDIRKQFKQPHQKLSVSDRDLEILEKEILDLIDGDKKEQAKTLFDNIQFTDKEAAQVTPEFAKLHSILGEYQKNGHILSITQDGKDLLVSCSPISSLEMKQQIEQLGYECEETDESEIEDPYSLPSYTLRIKMK